MQNIFVYTTLFNANRWRCTKSASTRGQRNAAASNPWGLIKLRQTSPQGGRAAVTSCRLPDNSCERARRQIMPVPCRGRPIGIYVPTVSAANYAMRR